MYNAIETPKYKINKNDITNINTILNDLASIISYNKSIIQKQAPINAITPVFFNIFTFFSQKGLLFFKESNNSINLCAIIINIIPLGYMINALAFKFSPNSFKTNGNITNINIPK